MAYNVGMLGSDWVVALDARNLRFSFPALERLQRHGRSLYLEVSISAWPLFDCSEQILIPESLLFKFGHLLDVAQSESGFGSCTTQTHPYSRKTQKGSLKS